MIQDLLHAAVTDQLGALRDLVDASAARDLGPALSKADVATGAQIGELARRIVEVESAVGSITATLAALRSDMDALLRRSPGEIPEGLAARVAQLPTRADHEELAAELRNLAERLGIRTSRTQ